MHEMLTKLKCINIFKIVIKDEMSNVFQPRATQFVPKLAGGECFAPLATSDRMGWIWTACLLYPLYSRYYRSTSYVKSDPAHHNCVPGLGTVLLETAGS